MLEDLTDEEWEDWLAFDRASPVGGDRNDVLTMLLMSAWLSGDPPKPPWYDDEDEDDYWLAKIRKKRRERCQDLGRSQ